MPALHLDPGVAVGCLDDPVGRELDLLLDLVRPSFELPAHQALDCVDRVLVGLVTAWRRATWPTRRSPLAGKPTTARRGPCALGVGNDLSRPAPTRRSRPRPPRRTSLSCRGRSRSPSPCREHTSRRAPGWARNGMSVRQIPSHRLVHLSVRDDEALISRRGFVFERSPKIEPRAVVQPSAKRSTMAPGFPNRGRRSSGP